MHICDVIRSRLRQGKGSGCCRQTYGGVLVRWCPAAHEATCVLGRWPRRCPAAGGGSGSGPASHTHGKCRHGSEVRLSQDLRRLPSPDQAGPPIPRRQKLLPVPVRVHQLPHKQHSTEWASDLAAGRARLGLLHRSIVFILPLGSGLWLKLSLSVVQPLTARGDADPSSGSKECARLANSADSEPNLPTCREDTSRGDNSQGMPSHPIRLTRARRVSKHPTVLYFPHRLL
jgi:hypothetical protein